MKLELNGIEVNCIIGDRPEERVRPQLLLVDVELTVPDTAADTDCLKDTVDYVTLGETISAALVWAKCRMIERAAKVVFNACMLVEEVEHAKIRVTKTRAVPNIASASAVYEGGRA